MQALKHCLNPKVIAAVAVVGAGVYLFAPGAFAAVLPLLVLAICPLSMVLMMAVMSAGSSSDSCSQEEAAASGSLDAAGLLRARVEELERQLAEVAAEPGADRSAPQQTV